MYSILMKIQVILLFCNEMGILNIDINNINLDNNFNEDDLDTIILIRLLDWYIKFEKRKALEFEKSKELKKMLNEELMPTIARHPKRWWNFCMAEDEKKRNRTDFY